MFPLIKFANHIRDVFSQRPDTTYYDFPSELMKDFRVTSVEDAEKFIDEFTDQEEAVATLKAAGWRPSQRIVPPYPRRPEYSH